MTREHRDLLITLAAMLAIVVAAVLAALWLRTVLDYTWSFIDPPGIPADYQLETL